METTNECWARVAREFLGPQLAERLDSLVQHQRTDPDKLPGAATGDFWKDQAEYWKAQAERLRQQPASELLQRVVEENAEQLARELGCTPAEVLAEAPSAERPQCRVCLGAGEVVCPLCEGEGFR